MRPRQGVTQTVAAKHFNIHDSTFNSWKNKGWAVFYEDGSVDIDATAASVAANRHLPDPRTYKKDKEEQPRFSLVSTNLSDVPTIITFAEAKRRKEYWNSQLAEQEAKRVKGELISLAAAERAYTAVVTAALANLDTLPARITPLVLGVTDAKKVRETIRRELSSALRALQVKPPEVKDGR
jgi:hypothetical protein